MYLLLLGDCTAVALDKTLFKMMDLLDKTIESSGVVRVSTCSSFWQNCWRTKNL